MILPICPRGQPHTIFVARAGILRATCFAGHALLFSKTLENLTNKKTQWQSRGGHKF